MRETSNISRNLNGQKSCWSLRCSLSIACRRYYDYIFILDLTPGFNGLDQDNCKTKLGSNKFWDLVRLILEVLRYVFIKEIPPLHHIMKKTCWNNYWDCIAIAISLVWLISFFFYFTGHVVTYPCLHFNQCKLVKRVAGVGTFLGYIIFLWSLPEFV